jgi:hypothetical protein
MVRVLVYRSGESCLWMRKTLLIQEIPRFTGTFAWQKRAVTPVHACHILFSSNILQRSNSRRGDIARMQSACRLYSSRIESNLSQSNLSQSVEFESVSDAADAAPGMMKMELSSGSLASGGWRRIRGRSFNGAASPRVSLTRTSPRTRYCRPRSAGEHVEQTASPATSSGARLRPRDGVGLIDGVAELLLFLG